MKTGPIALEQGFTLAELLIALLILGVIATFTIPKILQSQQSGQYNSMAKETIAMISGAYQAYKLNNIVSANTAQSDLTQYMNYVKVDSTSDIDDNPNDANGLACAGQGCLRLHTGGVLWYPTSNGWGTKFGGTAVTNALYFQFDPDGLNLNTSGADGPGKGLEIWIYSNGMVRTAANLESNSCNNDFCNGPLANGDPSWFSW